MEIQVSQKFCILTPLSPKLDKRECLRIKEELKNYPDLIIGLNMDFVQDCTIDFLEFIKDLKAGIFNIQSDVFSLFNIMSIDKTAELYVTEEDFLNRKRQLLNRKFSVI